jgi:hypothetical protein
MAEPATEETVVEEETSVQEHFPTPAVTRAGESREKGKQGGRNKEGGPAKPRRERHDRGREDDRVVAFGDHMPAFLSREIPVKNG